MAATTGLVSTLRAVATNPFSERWPKRAHSTETVASVHSVSALKTSTSATDDSAASPSTDLAYGTPSSTLFENIPPNANTDCATPSSRNSRRPSSRPIPNTMKQPPMNATSRRLSTGGNFDRPLIRRNSSAGSASANTKRVSATLAELGQLLSRAKAYPAMTRMNSGAARAKWVKKALIGAGDSGHRVADKISIMHEYENFMRHVFEHGVDKNDRTGTGARSVFGYQMRFDLGQGFPLVTTKKLHLRSIIHELLWFLKGTSNVEYLQRNGVTIDRKSTRLNSSHSSISYAVFCLKKKT